MKRDTTRLQGSRWRRLGNTAIALAAVALIGTATMAPAMAEWHGRGHYDGGVGFGVSVGVPAYGYGYYPYPAYPAYSPYYGYPYYYGGYYPYGGPSFSVNVR